MAEGNDKKEQSFTFHETTATYIEEEARKMGMSPEEFVEDVLTGRPFAVLEFEETTGKVKMKVWSPDPTETIAGKPKDGPTRLQSYRQLRDDFPPVSAGINYHKRFMLGGGFIEEIEDPLNPHQLEMQSITKKFDDDIYQDYYNRSLKRLLDPLVDEALTVGCAAAEIVYDNDDDFDFFGFKSGKRPPFVESVTEIVNEQTKTKTKVYETRDLQGSDWKKLHGIIRLKFIEDAVNRMTPYRDSQSEDLRYWIVDRERQTERDRLNPQDAKKNATSKETYLHPWQTFWLTWNGRGLNMHGVSMIKAVYNTALLVRIIKASMGKGYQRWADKKYFFISGTENRPWGRTATRGFIKAMELMIKNNWTGIPVPAGFDVKDIGGEIFDATNFLNFLITMICSGMNYPKDFFLQESRAGENKEAWIAWQNTYGYNQEYLRDAIQNQLWEKHLWGVVGRQTYRVKKQGVKPKDREKRPIFIPRVQWRSETKWLIESRMDLLTKVMNVANPASPPVKLAVEKDMVRTLGLPNVKFPTVKELERELKEQDRIAGIKADVEKMRLQVEILKLQYMIEHPKVITDPLKMETQPPATTQPPEKEETEEERLKGQTEKRKEGGVSRTTKETGDESKKGVARPQGSTRKPRP